MPDSISDRTQISPELSPVKRALHEIRTLRARVEELEAASHEPIAIIGVGLKFPGGVIDESSFWNLLAEGRDAITEIPRERWDWRAYFNADPDVPGSMVTRHGGFVAGVDLFDAAFFGISPREAVAMDPQHRLALEVGWEALENAGYAGAALQDTPTGVFLGIGNHDYGRFALADLEHIDAYTGSGNSPAMVAGRLSYFLGLHGPSLAIDTSCSSSLVAVHLACQSLRAAECRLALAGGVSLILSPDSNIALSKAHMMARDGHCKTFDESADGYVRSEGCGVVVLKKLSDAVSDGDRILAVIRGSAVNHDGRSGGLTAPNGPAQAAVIRAALEMAQVNAAEIGYLETHGTGTALGDPIEVETLASVLGSGRTANTPLAIGSVKTNLGHLEAASGIAGLLKAVSGAAASCGSAESAPEAEKFSHRLGSSAGYGADSGGRMESSGRSSIRRCQLVRFQRNQCARCIARSSARGTRSPCRRTSTTYSRHLRQNEDSPRRTLRAVCYGTSRHSFRCIAGLLLHRKFRTSRLFASRRSSWRNC